MVGSSWSTWVPWETFWAEGYKAVHMQNPGVYALACFDQPPGGTADPGHEHVVYVGETTRRTLSNRLYQFNQTVHEAKPGHSGGWTYLDRKREGSLPGGALHVAVLSFPRDAHPFLSCFIKHMERAAIWEYVSRHGRPPLCNRN